MRDIASHLLPALLLVAALAPASASAQTIDFGDDNGRFSKDGECDDMRFSGPGMTDTLLIDSDIRHDASDCRAAYEQGRLTYQGGRRGNTSPASAPNSRIIWGDDSGKYARDGECDDKRFSGEGMTDTPLLDSDIKHDATDCRVAHEQGRLQLRQ